MKGFFLLRFFHHATKQEFCPDAMLDPSALLLFGLFCLLYCFKLRSNVNLNLKFRIFFLMLCVCVFYLRCCHFRGWGKILVRFWRLLMVNVLVLFSKIFWKSPFFHHGRISSGSAGMFFHSSKRVFNSNFIFSLDLSPKRIGAVCVLHAAPQKVISTLLLGY